MQTSRIHSVQSNEPRRPSFSAFAGATVIAAGLMSGCRSADPSPLPIPSSSDIVPAVHYPSAVPFTLTPPGKGCPRLMARIEGYCIDLYEAYVVELTGGIGYQPHPGYEQINGKRVMAKVARGVMPQGYINQAEAENACEEAGKRLCTSAEWLKACLGPSNLRFMYGTAEMPGKCNTRKTHLLSILHGADRAKWTLEDFNDPALDTMPGFLEMTGSNPSCVSGYGVFDMIGNLAEWVSDQITAKADLTPLRPGAKATGMSGIGNGVFMGSFFGDSNENGDGCYYKTTAHEPTYHDYSTGFRCCKDAK